MAKKMAIVMAVAASAGAMVSAPVMAEASAEYRNEIRNDISRCRADKGPALLVTVDGVRQSSGTVRVQTYHATATDWMEKGKWLSRIEAPARAGTMTFCVPVRGAGTYGVAVRHDINGNGRTDVRTDGGAVSNNPQINIFNLGKPSYRKVGVNVGQGVQSIRVHMQYM